MVAGIALGVLIDEHSRIHPFPIILGVSLFIIGCGLALHHELKQSRHDS